MSRPLRYTASPDGIRTLLLDRPERRNALNAALVEALKEGLARAAQDPDAKVVVLRGAGTDFCSGADLAELERIAEMGAEESLADAQSMGDLFIAMRRHPLPIVAVIHGRALAGGAGLATACDLVVAHETAELGYPEVHLGFVPAMVMAILRRKVGEAVAFELVARGHRIDAVEARRLGLVNAVVPAASFEEDVEEWLSDLASRPTSAVRLSKRLLYGLDGTSFEDGIRRGAEVNVVARLTEACREGIRRFLGKAGG